MHLDIMPEEIIEKYNLHLLVDSDGWIYIEIMKGMYGLPHTKLLANKLLGERLAAWVFNQCQFTLCLWQHVLQPIKYEGKQNANYLIDTPITMKSH